MLAATTGSPPIHPAMVFQHFPETDTGDLRRQKIPEDLVHLPGKPDSELIGSRTEWENDVSEGEGKGWEVGRERCITGIPECIILLPLEVASEAKNWRYQNTEIRMDTKRFIRRVGCGAIKRAALR